MIIPSIDIMDGKAVQLKQGKTKVLEKENVFELEEIYYCYNILKLVIFKAIYSEIH